MNMKKTIAGVMAGAMAVSAMAAVVSADQDSISLTYDLKTYVSNPNQTKASVTYSIAFSAGSDEYRFDDSVLEVGVKQDWIDRTYETTIDGTTKVALADGSDSTGAVYVKDSNGNVTFTAADEKNAKGRKVADSGAGKMKEVEVSFTPIKNLVSDTVGATVTKKWCAADDSDRIVKGAVPALGLENGQNNAKIFTITLDKVGNNNSSTALNIAGFNKTTLGYSDSKDAAGKDIYAFQNGLIKVTYEVPNQVYADVHKNWLNDKYVPTFNTWMGINTMGDKTLEAKDFAQGDWNHGYIAAPTSRVDGVNLEPVSISVSGFTAGATADKIYPLKSSLTNPANVTEALKSRKAGGKYYTNPVAVLNDAIANNENVVFEFKSYNGYVTTVKSMAYTGDWVGEGVAHGYQTSPYDWYNPTFGQHLYTNLDNSYSLMGSTEFDMYGSYSSAWAQNLFTGAIVVNSGLTMQLSDTDKFNWGADTLSFDWFTITDEGKVTEAKTFLTKMLLYTPIDWYWDTLTVTVGNLETDGVEPGAGVGDDGDEIDDGGDEIVIDPIEEIDDPVEVTEAPVEVTEAPVTEATPVAPVTSPKTGNAPVALAVIPVALAAAAVVAKKRG